MANTFRSILLLARAKIVNGKKACWRIPVSIQTTTTTMEPNDDATDQANGAAETSLSYHHEADKSLFGTLSLRLAQSFSRSIAQALQEGIATLPALEETAATLLRDRLQAVYDRYIDTFEIFIHRNIFTISRVQPPEIRPAVAQLLASLYSTNGNDMDDPIAAAAARSKVVESWLVEEEEEENDTKNPPSNLDDADDIAMEEDPNVPTSVSEEDLIQISQGIFALHNRLSSLRTEKKTLQATLEKASAVQSLGQDLSQSLLQLKQDHPLQFSEQEIQAVKKRGRDCLETMAARKQQRNGNNNKIVILAPSQSQPPTRSTPQSTHRKFELEEETWKENAQKFVMAVRDADAEPKK